MASDDPFELIWNTYQVTRDCHKVAGKMVNESNDYFLEGTQFVALSKNDAAGSIMQSRQESDDFVIVSLWAAFERIVVNYVQARGLKLLEEPPELTIASLARKVSERCGIFKIQ